MGLSSNLQPRFLSSRNRSPLLSVSQLLMTVCYRGRSTIKISLWFLGRTCGGALQHRSTNPNDSRVCLPEHSERERAHLIVSNIIKEDKYKKKQSGTEEYKEKDQLLEERKQLYLDQEKKTESASARAKKDKSAASDLQSAALKRLAATRPGDEGTHSPIEKKRSTSFADVYAQRNQEREERRERELKLKEEALKLEKEKIEISRIQAETPKAKANGEHEEREAASDRMKTLIEGQNQLIRMLLEKR